jgi:hypothetical protein
MLNPVDSITVERLGKAIFFVIPFSGGSDRARQLYAPFVLQTGSCSAAIVIIAAALKHPTWRLNSGGAGCLWQPA